MTRISILKVAFAGLLWSVTLWDVPVYSQDAEPAAMETEASGAADPSAPAAVTASDPQIPVDELELLVKPLELSELELEAGAWQSLLKNKVREISEAEIAIKRGNEVISKREEAARALEQAQMALTEAETVLESAAPDSPEYEAATRNFEESRDKVRQAQAALAEATAAQESLLTDESLQEALAEAEQTGLLAEARRVLNQARQDRQELSVDSAEYQEATAKIDTLDSAILATEAALDAQQSVAPDAPELEELTVELEAARETLRQATEAAASAEDNASRILSQARRDRDTLDRNSLAFRQATQAIRALETAIEDEQLVIERLEGLAEGSPEYDDALATLERVEITLEQATREAARLPENASRILTESQAELSTLEEGSPAYTEASQMIAVLESALADFEAATAALEELEPDAPEFETAAETLESARLALQEATDEATTPLEKAQRTLYRARQAQRGFDGSNELSEQRLEALETAIADYQEAQAAVAEDPDNEEANAELESSRQQLVDTTAAAADASVLLVQAQRLLEESETIRSELDEESEEYESANETISRLQSAITSFEETLVAGGAVDPLRDPLQQASREAVQEILPAPTTASTPTETGAGLSQGAEPSTEGETVAEEAAEIEEVATDLQEQAEAEAELKNQLVATVTELQSQRTAIADRFRTVLDELDRKGGDSTSYRSYISAVSGVVIDIEDTEGLGVRVISWIRSEEGGLRWGINIATFVGIIIASIILSQILGVLVGLGLRLVRTSVLLRRFLVMVVSRGGVIIGVFVGLTALEISIGPIIALLGGLGFVLAFAWQSNLGNLASGLMLMVYKPFDVDDEVQVAGYWGIIRNITLATTELQTWNHGKVINIPNNTVWSSSIVNMTPRDGIRKIVETINVAGDADLPLVKQIVEDTLNEHPLVIKEHWHGSFVWEVKEAATVYYVARVSADDYWMVYEQLLLRIQNRLIQAGVPFAAPRYEVSLTPPGTNGSHGSNGSTVDLTGSELASETGGNGNKISQRAMGYDFKPDEGEGAAPEFEPEPGL